MKLDTLYILKVPPPVHGSTMMNQIIAESDILVNKRNRKAIEQSISTNTEEIGKFTVKKVSKVLKNYSKLFNTLLKERPRLVYFAISPLDAAFIKDFISVLIVKLFRIPILYHIHGKGIKNASQNPILNMMYRFVFNNQYVIILSDYLRYDLEAFDFKKVFVVGNGIRDLRNKIVEEKGDENKLFTITYLSNFIKEKGIVEFIETLGLLKKEGREFRAKIIGGAIDLSKEEVSSLIERYGLKNHINHLGAAYGNDKYKLLSESDLFIFPTYYRNECYPLVLLEAMCFGLPIITSNEGGIRDIVKDGVNGFIVDPKNTKEIASKVSSLIENSDLHQKMAENSRSLFVKHHTVEKFEGNLDEVIKQTLKIEYS
ncbi:glycosyltransferase [Gracilimonas sp.]|uniref:glycosyltransferase n=1 Tax=Gracilimonas sp. TaxID=1974203 RepID=UPI003D147C29